MFNVETVRPTFAALGAFLVFRGAQRSLVGVVTAATTVSDADAFATARCVWRRTVGVVVVRKAIPGRTDRVEIDITPLF